MKLVLAFLIFCALLFINVLMKNKINMNNKADYINSIGRDPVKIVSHLRSELKEMGPRVNQARISGNNAMLAKYFREIMDLSRSAQLLVIDLDVILLDIRGSLLKEYGGLKDDNFKLKYDEYKKNFWKQEASRWRLLSLWI